MNRPAWLLSFLGILLILGTAILQALGFCAPLEDRLLSFFHPHLPPPRVILIWLESTRHGFPTMDVAMTLRGLSHLAPRCIVINGEIEPEQSTPAFLPEIMGRLSKITGLTLIVPHTSSPKAEFQSIPLIRYSLVPIVSRWPLLDGKATSARDGAFLPGSLLPSDTSLPLLAKTPDGATIGSLWWWALPQTAGNKIQSKPPLLLFEKFLFYGDHVALHLTPSGAITPSLSGEILEMPLDDFLLQIEQKEQGTISPTFDSLWSNSTVVIGRHEDVAMVASFSALLNESSRNHLPFWMMGAFALIAIITLLGHL